MSQKAILPPSRKKKKSWRDGAGSLILIFTVGDFTQVQSSPWSRNSPWMCHIGFTALGCNSVLLFFLLYIKWVKLKEIIESETGFLFENLEEDMLGLWGWLEKVLLRISLSEWPGLQLSISKVPSPPTNTARITKRSATPGEKGSEVIQVALAKRWIRKYYTILYSFRKQVLSLGIGKPLFTLSSNKMKCRLNFTCILMCFYILSCFMFSAIAKTYYHFSPWNIKVSCSDVQT